MIEKYLIGHCSPTLASLKTANLMNIPFESMTQLESSINKTNDKLNNKGVELIILKKSDKSALVYAFRKSRLQNDLNEIGIFLGYPLADVKGFIENAGKNSKCSGCWKVYCNECEAIKTFKKFEKCKKVYQKLWLQGRSIAKLTVAA